MTTSSASHTRTCGWTRRLSIILWAGLLTAGVGCQQTQVRQPIDRSQSAAFTADERAETAQMDRRPITTAPGDAPPLSSEAAATDRGDTTGRGFEQGPPTTTEEMIAAERPDVPLIELPPPSPPPDPGARLLVQQIAAAIDDGAPPPPGDEEGYVINIARLQNLSRSTDREFDAFRDRLADLLDRGSIGVTAAGQPLSFTSDTSSTTEVDFHLLGSAYLVYAQGFNQWELYLSLQPADAAWTLWQAPAPVRVLRQPRPGQPQLFLLSNTEAPPQSTFIDD